MLIESNPVRGSASIPELILYYREGCHLCEDLEQQLHELLEPGSFRLTRVDIDQDARLRQAYNARVPVLSLFEATEPDQAEPWGPENVSTVELCEHFLDLEAVKQALAGYNREFPAARDTPARW